ncbi:hypothetical protein XELAEV_18008677mg [Xenopus laevis]|uniref:Uncharacterized protein n=1 Tax=Xenopus laevis TaxID=8355 RepID=A0A974I045_XENLA|nr:hypothetical protein XELAEV_18008677mg [Xenopus laevis]
MKERGEGVCQARLPRAPSRPGPDYQAYMEHTIVPYMNWVFGLPNISSKQCNPILATPLCHRIYSINFLPSTCPESPLLIERALGISLHGSAIWGYTYKWLHYK